MSDLQMWLALLGAALVAGIFVFSRIQEYRHRRLANHVLPEHDEDVLLQGALASERSEPKFQHSEEDAATLVEIPGPDPAVEFTVLLQGDHTVSGAELWQALITSAISTRNIRWAGQEMIGGQWFSVDGPTDHRFAVLAGMLQLSSRRGPLNQTQIALFSDEMREISRQLQVSPQVGDAAIALKASESLDQFCAKVDVLIGVNVIFPEGSTLPAHRLRQAAEAEGLLLGDDGVFHVMDARHRDRFTLAHRDGQPFLDNDLDVTPISGLTLLLDVPRVDDALTALHDMFSLAGRLSQELGGRVVDDNGAALGAPQLAVIEKQLSSLLQQMEQQKIPAGSALALRLFSN